MKSLTFVFILMLSTIAFGQVGAAEFAGNGDVATAGLQALALAFNAGGVWFLVFLVNKYRPKLREHAPHWIPVIAMLAGPILNAIATLILNEAGIAVDFSPLIAALAGTGAVALDQVGRQYRKRPRSGNVFA